MDVYRITYPIAFFDCFSSGAVVTGSFNDVQVGVYNAVRKIKRKKKTEKRLKKQLKPAETESAYQSNKCNCWPSRGLSRLGRRPCR